jgi:hypothetical protein
VVDDVRKRNLDAIMGSLQRMAMQVLEAPKEDREKVYEEIREDFAETWRAHGAAFNVGPDFIEQYMIHLRALVSIIERGGGAAGGTA